MSSGPLDSTTGALTLLSAKNQNRWASRSTKGERPWYRWKRSNANNKEDDESATIIMGHQPNFLPGHIAAQSAYPLIAHPGQPVQRSLEETRFYNRLIQAMRTLTATLYEHSDPSLLGASPETACEDSYNLSIWEKEGTPVLTLLESALEGVIMDCKILKDNQSRTTPLSLVGRHNFDHFWNPVFASNEDLCQDKPDAAVITDCNKSVYKFLGQEWKTWCKPRTAEEAVDQLVGGLEALTDAIQTEKARARTAPADASSSGGGNDSSQRLGPSDASDTVDGEPGWTQSEVWMAVGLTGAATSLLTVGAAWALGCVTGSEKD